MRWKDRIKEAREGEDTVEEGRVKVVGIEVASG